MMILFLLFVCSAVWSARGFFTDSTSIPGGYRSGRGCLAVGDVDGDGLQDLFGLGENIQSGLPTVEFDGFVALQNGVGGFTDATSDYFTIYGSYGGNPIIMPEFVSYAFADCALRDIDGNNQTDFIFTTPGDGNVYIILQDGNTLVNTSLGGAGFSSCTWSQLAIDDFTGDGRLDVAFSCSTAAGGVELLLMEQQPDASFVDVAADYFMAELPPLDAMDHRFMMAMAPSPQFSTEAGNGSTMFLFGQADAAFRHLYSQAAIGTNFTLWPGGPDPIAGGIDLRYDWLKGIHADLFPNNSAWEVVTCGTRDSNGAPVTVAYTLGYNPIFGRGNVEFRFSPAMVTIPNVTHCAMDVQDANMDNRPDLLLAGRVNAGDSTGSSAQTYVLLQTQTGSFLAFQPDVPFPGFSTGAGVWIDVGGDGLLDAVVTGLQAPAADRSTAMLIRQFSCPDGDVFNTTSRACEFCFGTPSVGLTLCTPCSNTSYFEYSELRCLPCGAVEGGRPSANGTQCLCPEGQRYSIGGLTCVPVGAASGGDGDGASGLGAGGIAGLVVGVVLVFCCAVCLLGIIACGCCLLLMALLVVAALVVALVIIVIVALAGGVGGGMIIKKKASVAGISAGDLSALDGYTGEAVNDGLKRDFRELAFEDLTFRKKIGEGAFGRVFSGLWRESTLVAIKELNVKTDEKARAEFVHEANVMARLGNHPSVVHFIGAITTQEDRFYMVVEFAQHGSLLDYLKKNPSLPIEDRMRFAAEAAAGLVHLHAEGVVHRDIAARNFLVGRDLGVMVADFGLSRVVEAAEGGEEAAAQRTESNIGPVRWMAPESIRNREYSVKSDVWMFGCFLIELVTGDMPFPRMELMEIAQLVGNQGRAPEVPRSCPFELATVMKSCWQLSPAKRPSMKRVFKMLAGDEKDTAASTGDLSSSAAGAAASGLGQYVKMGADSSTEGVTQNYSSMSAGDKKSEHNSEPPPAARSSTISAEYAVAGIEGDDAQEQKEDNGSTGEYFTKVQQRPSTVNEVDDLPQKLEEKDAELRRKDKKIRKLKKLEMSEESD